MKTTHPFRPGRHEQRMEELREDPYRAGEKLDDGTSCSKCGATFWKGRWTWRKAGHEAEVTKCPACHRIEDDFPAGYVALKGPFVAQHRDEILEVVKARAARAREEHPLQRIMAIADTADGVLVTTTDAHLARGIGTALNDAFKGTLDINYHRGENLVRATWRR